MSDQERIEQLEAALKQLRQEFDDFKRDIEHSFNPAFFSANR